MHESVQRWGRYVIDRYQLAGCNMLELGARNVNGSLRGLFTATVLGVDLQPGPGVDLVATAADLPFETGQWPVIVCTEMLEHDPAPWLSVPEMARVLAPGGHLLLTCRGIGFGVHNPPDYWRFTGPAVRLLIADAGLDVVELVDDDPANPGVLCVARKTGSSR